MTRCPTLVGDASVPDQCRTFALALSPITLSLIISEITSSQFTADGIMEPSSRRILEPRVIAMLFGVMRLSSPCASTAAMCARLRFKSQRDVGGSWRAPSRSAFSP